MWATGKHKNTGMEIRTGTETRTGTEMGMERAKRCGEPDPVPWPYCRRESQICMN